MCGQAGIHRRNGKNVPKLNDLIDGLLYAIENRGKHATGFVALMDSGKVQLEKAAVPASRFVNRRKKVSASAKTILLHTRYATIGDKDDPRNAHPVACGTIAAVHNGTIRNATEIFTAFGLPRRAEVDSEVIPAIIDHAGWDHVKDAIDLLEGSAAIGIINTEHPEEVILARTRHYPMVYLITDEMVVWASTRQAIESAWRRAYGRKPEGTFHTLGEWEMARVNGTVEVTRIRALPPRPPAPKRKPMRAGKRGPAVSKRARKRAKKASRTAATTTHWYQDADADFPRTSASASLSYEDQVSELMFYESFTRAQAEDVVYGFAPSWADEADREYEDKLFNGRSGMESMLQLESGEIEWAR